MKFKLKDFIVPFALAVGFTVIFHHFFLERGSGTRSDQIVAGRSHVAPGEVQRPVNREIDFIDTVKQEAKLTDVAMDYGKAIFSTVGGTLQKLEFNHATSEESPVLVTVDSKGDEDGAFLLGLEGKSPLYYDLVSNVATDDKTEITYRSDFDLGTITKKFTIFKRINKIDLNITVEPKGTDSLRLRLFYPAPKIQGYNKDVIQAVYEEGGSTYKKPSDKVMDKFWDSTALFGAEDKYFLNALYRDDNNFVQRCYYKKSTDGLLTSVLETGKINDKKSYNLSFFFGPKKVSAILPVSDSLEVTLDYGFFSPLAKLLLKLLNFLYSYVLNYGWAIILLALLIKLLTLPFSLKFEDDKKKKEYERLNKDLDARYKDNPQELARAKTELMRTHGVPGLGGLFVNILQLPVFIALNRVLMNSVDLFDAPFLWIPSLAGPDPYFILPVLVGLSIIVHGIVTTKDPKQRTVPYVLGFVLAVFIAGFPSGLVIFIFSSTILSAVQMFIVKLVKKS